MPVCDASSIIYAWDNYPIGQFPGLWEWLAEQVAGGALVMPGVAFDEVARKSSECAQWLKKKGLVPLEIGNAIAQDALRIKGLIGIVGDDYHPKGVGENDILIIATARSRKDVLVSDEGRQYKLPDILTKCKIPAVCGMQGVGVRCISFLEYVKESGEVFR